MNGDLIDKKKVTIKFYKSLFEVVESIKKKEPQSIAYEKERKLYSQFKIGLKSKQNIQDIEYFQKKTFYESFCYWRYFHETVGSKKKVLSSIELKTFRYFYANRPLANLHAVQSSNISAKLKILSDDVSCIQKECRNIKKNIKKRKAIINSFKAKVQNTSSHELNENKVFNLFVKLFPSAPLFKVEVRCIFTEISLFFVIPPLKELEKTETFQTRKTADKKKVLDFYKLINDFQFRFFENFPVFSVFDSREVGEKFCKNLSKETGINLSELKELLNSQCMLHFSNTIEMYMIHDTWGHIWQAELAKGRYYYDKMANYRRPFYPEHQVTIEENVVSFIDLFYLKGDGELLFDEDMAGNYIDQYFKDSLAILFHATMSEMCAEITEYLFVSDYGSHLKLDSSSRFHHNPTKLDFAWSDLNYFIQMLTTPYRRYKNDANFVDNFVDRVCILLEFKYKERFLKVKSQTKLKKEMKKHSVYFLTLFKDKQIDQFKLPLASSSIEEINKCKTLKIFQQILKIQNTVNYIFSSYFRDDGEKLSKYRIVTLLYIYKIFEEKPEEIFWSLDEILQNNLISLLELTKNAEP